MAGQAAGTRRRVLVTGSRGLIGAALTEALVASGIEVTGLDLRTSAEEDVTNARAVERVIAGCVGVVHLAAVSRVILGERDPTLCQRTNVEGTAIVVRASVASAQRPWIVFASSREVYGEAESLPAHEDTPLRPVNVYGRSKQTGEQLVLSAREAGLRTAVVRLSSVYGHANDHADRVVPAFARAALAGEPLWVEGAEHVFDFTHIDDVVRGIVAVMARLEGTDPPPPPIQFVTGRPTALGELAALAVELSRSRSPILTRRPRDFDVGRFWGSHDRARRLLGWAPRIDLRAGLRTLIDSYRSVG